MTSFRELEALVAVSDLGSFEKAARSLSTSQSAVSRLIRELESSFERPLFDRELRKARLNAEGRAALEIARKILDCRAALIERFASAELNAPILRLGVTELTAATWLPRFVQRIKDRYPRVQVAIEIESSTLLLAALHEGRLDLAFAMDVVNSTGMARVPIGTAKFGWYCGPQSTLPRELTLEVFQRQTLLLQGPTTGAGVAMATWFSTHGIKPSNIIYGNSAAALSGIAAAGLGIISLPRSLAMDPVQQGALCEVRLPVPPPLACYIALGRTGGLTLFHRNLIALAQETCEFSLPFHVTGHRQAGLYREPNDAM